jgi:hypothetical protein
MIHRLRLALVLAVTALAISVPATGFAASSTHNKQLARTFKQLKRLPNANTPAPRVRGLLLRLSRLNPKGASTYYKFALRKLAPTNAEQTANQFIRQITVIVKKSGLPGNQVSRITRVIVKTFKHYAPPTPTPTPYQASVSPADEKAVQVG